MWKFLFGLILALNEISGKYADRKRRSSILSETEIRQKRYLLEQQHHIHYTVNEDMYRKWPEVHENPNHNCQGFLLRIFPAKKDIAFVTPGIRKVILNYRQIRDEKNNMITSRRVTALECRLPIPVWRRKFIYFIRSPHSPKCVLFLNRIGRRSFNFYIVEEICEYKEYVHFWQYIEELKDDKLNGSKSRRCRRRMFRLPDKEIEVKHAEFEQKHYDYCSSNPELCNIWPEVHANPNYECQRFFRRILPPMQDLSLVIALLHPTILHYLEIRDENDERLDSVLTNAVECRLPKIVEGQRKINFIRAPSYPSCVFYAIRKTLPNEHIYIAEEICDIPDYTTPLSTILLEHGRGTTFTKRIGQRGHESLVDLQKYEMLHFQDYTIKMIEYQEWPELGNVNTTFYCQTLIGNMFPQITDTSNQNEKLAAKSEPVALEYAIISGYLKDPLSPRIVKALECRMFGKTAPNQFWFIRTPKPNCVYWIKRRHEHQDYYYIAGEYCKGNVEVSNNFK